MTAKRKMPIFQQLTSNLIFLGILSASLLGASEFTFIEPPPKSYSLVDSSGVPLDHKLFELINSREGVFIEVGANDGISQSNTKIFEEFYDWKGILVEPSPCLFSSLIANRPNSQCFQCVLGAFEQENTFVTGDFDGHLMSSIGGARRHHQPAQVVLVRSLQSILDEMGYSHIDLFSLDTEGHELSILKGIDFSKTTFDYLLIEIYSWDLEEITGFLSDRGYNRLENFSNYNSVTNPFWDGTHNDYLFKRRI